MSLPSVQDRKYLSNDGTKRDKRPWGHWIACVLITLVAFALRFWFNFVDVHINCYGSCDASEYLRNTGALIDLIKLPPDFIQNAASVLIGNATPEIVDQVKASLSPLKELRISGPAFPLFLGTSYLASFSPFGMDNWIPPIFGQCLISALTCLFVALTTGRAFGRYTGYLAGAFAAIYPGFIVNSGRLYSETFAAFLLSVACYLTACNFNRDPLQNDMFKKSLWLGITTACLQVTRSIMVVLTIALIPVTIIQGIWRRGLAGCLSGLSGLIVGFLIVMLPWVALQKLTFGTSSLVVDRVGHYNLFIGNNTDTQGWLSVPYPDGNGIDEKPLPQLFKEAYKKNPRLWWHLQLDKPLRLFSFPWNDFRIPIGGSLISFQSQVMLHQALLLLAGLGLALAFVMPAANYSGHQEYDRAGANWQAATCTRLFLLFVLALHFAYLLFITVPRYNLTAMVVVLMFAAAGVTSIFHLFQANNGVKVATYVGVACVFLFTITKLPVVTLAATLFGEHQAIIGLIIGKLLSLLCLVALIGSLWMAVSCLAKGDQDRRTSGKYIARAALILMAIALTPLMILPANASGRWWEWQCPLSYKGQSIEQTFHLANDQQIADTNRQLYVMIDCDSATELNNLTVFVNDRPLDSAFIPAMSLNDEFQRFIASRQGQMREIEWVLSSLTEAWGHRNSDLRQWFICPIPQSIANGHQSLRVRVTQNSNSTSHLYGNYAKGASSRVIPSLHLWSWEKSFYGVENDQGLSDSRYNIKLAGLATESSNRDLSSLPGKQCGQYNIYILGGPSTNTYTGKYTVQLPSSLDRVQELHRQPVALRPLFDGKLENRTIAIDPPSFGGDDLWVVEATGYVRRTIGEATLSTQFKALGVDPKKDYVSPWTTSTPHDKEWHRFAVALPLQPAALPQTTHKLAFAFKNTNISLPAGESLSSGGMSELKDVTIKVTRLPGNPLHPGNVIY